jgi:hypothetical protein
MIRNTHGHNSSRSPSLKTEFQNEARSLRQRQRRYQSPGTASFPALEDVAKMCSTKVPCSILATLQTSLPRSKADTHGYGSGRVRLQTLSLQALPLATATAHLPRRPTIIRGLQ